MPANPVVSRFSIAPVKGFALLHPETIDLTEIGVLEDRRFFLVDPTGRLIDRLLVGSLVRIGAWTDPAATRLRLTLPDGEVLDDAVRLADPIVSQMYSRTVIGHVVDGPWASALEPLVGRPVRVVRTDRPGGTRVRHPATLVSEGSIGALEAQLGAGAIDGRRFRMLIDLSGGDDHEEDGWIGSRIALGEAILAISGRVPRCAITTQDPDTGERDLDTLRAIRTYRGLRDGGFIDFGVYGEVERPGRIALGDAVRILGEVAAAS